MPSPSPDRFRLIDHPSDVGIEAFGGSEKEVFENAAFGMFSLLADLEKVDTAATREVEASGSDYESLLVNWLNELIYRSEVDKMLFKEFTITALAPDHLQARVTGEKIDLKKHLLSHSIKAATYNQLTVSPSRAIIVFDV